MLIERKREVEEISVRNRQRNRGNGIGRGKYWTCHCFDSFDILRYRCRQIRTDRRHFFACGACVSVTSWNGEHAGQADAKQQRVLCRDLFIPCNARRLLQPGSYPFYMIYLMILPFTWFWFFLVCCVDQTWVCDYTTRQKSLVLFDSDAGTERGLTVSSGCPECCFDAPAANQRARANTSSTGTCGPVGSRYPTLHAFSFRGLAESRRIFTTGRIVSLHLLSLLFEGG